MRFWGLRLCAVMVCAALMGAVSAPPPGGYRFDTARDDTPSMTQTERMMPAAEASFPRWERQAGGGTHSTALYAVGARSVWSVRHTGPRLSIVYENSVAAPCSVRFRPVGSHAPPSDTSAFHIL